MEPDVWGGVLEDHVPFKGTPLSGSMLIGGRVGKVPTYSELTEGYRGVDFNRSQSNHREACGVHLPLLQKPLRYHEKTTGASFRSGLGRLVGFGETSGEM